MADETNLSNQDASKKKTPILGGKTRQDLIRILRKLGLKEEALNECLIEIVKRMNAPQPR